MPYVLNYTVENSQVVGQEVETDYQGQPARVLFHRAVIECLPSDPANKTFTLVLPPEAAADFPEGASVTVTVEINNG